MIEPELKEMELKKIVKEIKKEIEKEFPQWEFKMFFYPMYKVYVICVKYHIENDEDDTELYIIDRKINLYLYNCDEENIITDIIDTLDYELRYILDYISYYSHYNPGYNTRKIYKSVFGSTLYSDDYERVIKTDQFIEDYDNAFKRMTKEHQEYIIEKILNYIEKKLMNNWEPEEVSKKEFEEIKDEMKYDIFGVFYEI